VVAIISVIDEGFELKMLVNELNKHFETKEQRRALPVRPD